MINVQAVAQYLAATGNGSTQDNALIQQLMGIANTAQASGQDPTAAAAAALRAGAGGGQQFGGADVAAGPDGSYEAEVAEFLTRFPCDERAQDLLSKAPAVVKQRVLTQFRPRQEGQSDYSALVTTFTQKCIAQQSAAQHQGIPGGGAAYQQFMPRAQPTFADGQQILEAPAPADLATAAVTPGLDTFLAKYPVDERAYEFFCTSSHEVQEKVLREFRPKAEGEANYSGLFTSFVKRCRTAIEGGGMMGGGMMGGGMMGGGGGPQMFSMGGGKGGRADAGYRPPMNPANMAWAMEEVDPFNPPDLEGFRTRFPMDEKAWDFLQNVDPRVQKRVLETYRPQRMDDTDYSAGITSYLKSTKRIFQEAQAETNLTQESVDAFFLKYPCDERATEYFNACSREVQAAVLRDFRPRSEGDPDYSAAITSYIKRCRAWAEPRQVPQQQFGMQPQQQQFGMQQQQFGMQQQQYGMQQQQFPQQQMGMGMQQQQFGQQQMGMGGMGMGGKAGMMPQQQFGGDPAAKRMRFA